MQLTNGCVEDQSPGLDLEVLAALSRDGHCFVGVEDPGLSCTVVTVRATNPNPSHAWSLDARHWTALDAQGILWGDPFVDNATALSTGQQKEVLLGFTTPAGTTLVELRWDHPFTDPVRAPLPAA